MYFRQCGVYLLHVAHFIQAQNDIHISLSLNTSIKTYLPSLICQLTFKKKLSHLYRYIFIFFPEKTFFKRNRSDKIKFLASFSRCEADTLLSPHYFCDALKRDGKWGGGQGNAIVFQQTFFPANEL